MFFDTGRRSVLEPEVTCRQAPGGMGDTPFVSDRVIDGKAVAAQIRAEVAATVKHLQEKHGKVGGHPLLLAIQPVTVLAHIVVHSGHTQLMRDD